MSSQFILPSWRESDHAAVAMFDPVGPIGEQVFTGTSGHDDFSGTTGNDTFDMTQGGRDVVHGRGGNDDIAMGATLNAKDEIDGGADNGGFIDGRDTVFLAGDYWHGLVFGSHTVRNVELIALGTGFSYKLVLHEDTVGPGQQMGIEGSALGPADRMYIDTTADTDAQLLWIFGGNGQDTFVGGGGDETYTFDDGRLSPDDRCNGGGGFDTLDIGGGYIGTISPSMMRNIEDLTLSLGNFRLTMSDGDVVKDGFLFVQANNLSAGQSLVLDASAETNGKYIVTGGAGGDVIETGRGDDTIVGAGSSDDLFGGSGRDTYTYQAASDSTGSAFDVITGFNFTADDWLDLPSAITGIDRHIRHGELTVDGDFDAGLTAAAARLHAHHAVLFTPDSGDQAGQIYLVADLNGVKGYQSGADIVIRLVDPVHAAALDTLDFI